MQDLQHILAQAGYLDEGHLPIFVFAWESLLDGEKGPIPRTGFFFGDRPTLDTKIAKMFGGTGLEYFQPKLETLRVGGVYFMRITAWGFDFALVRVG